MQLLDKDDEAMHDLSWEVTSLHEACGRRVLTPHDVHRPLCVLGAIQARGVTSRLLLCKLGDHDWIHNKTGSTCSLLTCSSYIDIAVSLPLTSA
jgi:hypothetical protein